MARHRLKVWPQYFAAIRDNRKRFELRRNDRDYQPGDVLEFVEWDPNTQAETGAEPELRKCGYILNGPTFGLARGWCIIQLEGANG